MIELLLIGTALAVCSVILAASLTVISRDRGNHGLGWAILLTAAPFYALVVSRIVS